MCGVSETLSERDIDKQVRLATTYTPSLGGVQILPNNCISFQPFLCKRSTFGWVRDLSLKFVCEYSTL